MAKRKEAKIVIDHVENARLIKELQSEDWKVVRAMELFLVAFAQASVDRQAMTLQQFAEKYLKGVYDVNQYKAFHAKRQNYRDAIYNLKDVERLEAKVTQLTSEYEKIEAQIEYYDKAATLELVAPFSAEQYKQKVEKLSEIKKELQKFE